MIGFDEVVDNGVLVCSDAFGNRRQPLLFQPPVRSVDGHAEADDLRSFFQNNAAEIRQRPIVVPHVVAVQEKQILSPGRADPGVPRLRASGVLLMDRDNPVILCRIFIADPPAGVFRPVVDQ